MNKITLPWDGWRPRDYQIPAWNYFRAGGRRACLVFHRRAGKDEIILHNFAVSAFERVGNYWHLLPTHVQARRAMWQGVNPKTGRRRIFDAFGPYAPGRGGPLIKSINDQEMMVEFVNGSTYQVFGSDNFDSAVGSGPVGIAFSEFALANPDAWTYFSPMLVENNGWAAFISTPRGENHLYNLYTETSGDPSWHTELLTVDDTRFISQEELDADLRSKQATLGKAAGLAKWEQEWRCSFTAPTDDSFITFESVLMAQKRRHSFDDVNDRERVIGVDVARYGDDRSVIFKRQGPLAYAPEIRIDISNTDLAGLVAQAAADFKPHQINVDAGRGEGVIDRLRAMGFKVNEVNFGGTSGDPHCANKKAEMWSRMRAWIDDIGQLPESMDLRRDLITPKYAFNGKDQLTVEGKKDIKKRGYPSPDLADALALTFAAPVIVGGQDARHQPQLVVRRSNAETKQAIGRFIHHKKRRM